MRIGIIAIILVHPRGCRQGGGCECIVALLVGDHCSITVRLDAADLRGQLLPLRSDTKQGDREREDEDAHSQNPEPLAVLSACLSGWWLERFRAFHLTFDDDWYTIHGASL